MNRLIFYLLLALSCIALLASCYNTKKASWQLDKAHAKFPAITAEKSKLWYPCIPLDSSVETELKPGVDSSVYYKAKIDSLAAIKAKVKDSLAIRYKDSCRTVQDKYEQGFNLGYEVGRYDGLQDCIPDTVVHTKTITIEDGAKIKLAQLETEKMANKIRAKDMWLKIATIAWAITFLLALILFMLLKGRR